LLSASADMRVSMESVICRSLLAGAASAMAPPRFAWTPPPARAERIMRKERNRPHPPPKQQQNSPAGCFFMRAPSGACVRGCCTHPLRPRSISLRERRISVMRTIIRSISCTELKKRKAFFSSNGARFQLKVYAFRRLKGSKFQ
jgi:hypothetical protein